mmetsp:Transcript_4882/g.4591  ORF Transcript_4882/g.4591 Transcript_4882/m.4591 type:complete len:217 (-) Transcript_4882:283-933(-)
MYYYYFGVFSIKYVFKASSVIESEERVELSKDSVAFSAVTRECVGSQSSSHEIKDYGLFPQCFHPIAVGAHVIIEAIFLLIGFEYDYFVVGPYQKLHFIGSPRVALQFSFDVHGILVQLRNGHGRIGGQSSFQPCKRFLRTDFKRPRWTVPIQFFNIRRRYTIAILSLFRFWTSINSPRRTTTTNSNNSRESNRGCIIRCLILCTSWKRISQYQQR